MIDRLSNLVEELKERRAVRFLVGYLVGAWITAQVAGFFVEQGYVGRRLLDVTLFLVVVFFFLTVVLVWYHGEKGQQQVQRLEKFLIAVLLLVGAGGSAWIATRTADATFARTGRVVDLGDNSVAVLPFENQIMLSDYEWLDRGVADLLATDLSQFDTLRVVSGQRIFDLMRQRGIEEDVRVVPQNRQTEITEAAGARYMLTGSILGTPDNMQILAQLSDLESGDIRASSRAGGSDVFAIIDQISAQISTELMGREISPIETTPIAQLTTNSIEAYREYDAGKDAMWQFLTVEARDRFERAIALDSTFAAAHFQLAGLLFRLGDFGTATGHLQAAQRNLDNAPERDRLSIGAFYDFIVGNAEEGERKMRELLEKYPDEKDARIIYSGMLQGPLNRPEEIPGVLQDILELDPYYAEAYNLLAYGEARAGNFVAADTLIEEYVRLSPGLPNPLDSRGEILEMAGRLDEARVQYHAALEARADFAVSLGHLSRTYLREGRYDDLREAIGQYRGSEAPDTRVWAWWLDADSWMWEGDIERAMAGYDSLVVVAAGSGRPDLYAQVLDGLARTLILLEDYPRAKAVADSLAAARGQDGTTGAATLHLRGSQGDFEGMERLAEMIVEANRNAGVPESFIGAAQTGGGITTAYHRGDYAEAVRLVSEFNQSSPFPLTQYGYPGIRSALAIGDAAIARAGVNSMMFLAMAPEFRIPPLESRIREYFNARIAEIEGDTATAVSGYDRLIDAWGPSLEQVPLFTDVQDRRAALTSQQ